MLYSGKEKQEEQGHETVVNNNMGVVKASTGQKIAFVLFVVFTLGFFYIWKIVKHNKLVDLQIKINESASNIDVQLEKRFATLTKLVSAVKSQVQFNKETLENIAKYRSGISENATLSEKSAAIDKISSGINMSFEAYPQLGADVSVGKLMNETTLIEKEIAASRRLYNADVTMFNGEIYNFPLNVVTAKLKYSAIPLFAASKEHKKDVSLNF